MGGKGVKAEAEAYAENKIWARGGATLQQAGTHEGKVIAKATAYVDSTLETVTEFRPSGVDNIDTTSLASLTAGNIAATGGIANLLRENEFTTQFHEGKNAHIHIQLIKSRVILVVIFDARSSLGLVRLRVRKASDELGAIFDDISGTLSPALLVS